MPTYEYVCESCDHAFEEFQSMTEKPLRKCPACRKPRLRRLFGTGAGIIFKGSGFYETDYRRKTGAPKKEGESKAPEPKPEKKPDSPKKDSKKKDGA